MKACRFLRWHFLRTDTFHIERHRYIFNLTSSFRENEIFSINFLKYLILFVITKKELLNIHCVSLLSKSQLVRIQSLISFSENVC